MGHSLSHLHSVAASLGNGSSLDHPSGHRRDRQKLTLILFFQLEIVVPEKCRLRFRTLPPLFKRVLNFQVIILVLVKFNSSGINFELCVILVLDEPSEKNAIIKFVRKLRFVSYLQDRV